MGLGNAVRRYSKGIVPLLHQFAGGGFKGTTLDDLNSCDQRLSNVGKAPDITIKSNVANRGGTFIRTAFVATERFLSVTEPISDPLRAYDKLPGCFVSSFIVVK